MMNLQSYYTITPQGAGMTTRPQGAKSAGGGGGSSAPDIVKNSFAWFDAATGITLNGSDVSQWDDQTGNGRHLKQATAANQPEYDSNTPAVIFDGIDEFLESDAFAASLDQPFSVALVAQYVDGGATNTLYDNTTTSDKTSHGSWASNHQIDYGSFIFGGTPDTSRHILMILTSGLTKLYIDGTVTINGTIGANNMEGLKLGCLAQESDFLEGNISEFILFDQHLSDAEKNEVGNYLADKYGLTWGDI